MWFSHYHHSFLKVGSVSKNIFKFCTLRWYQTWSQKSLVNNSIPGEMLILAEMPGWIWNYQWERLCFLNPGHLWNENCQDFKKKIIMCLTVNGSLFIFQKSRALTGESGLGSLFTVCSISHNSLNALGEKWIKEPKSTMFTFNSHDLEESCGMPLWTHTVPNASTLEAVDRGWGGKTTNLNSEESVSRTLATPSAFCSHFIRCLKD